MSVLLQQLEPQQHFLGFGATFMPPSPSESFTSVLRTPESGNFTLYSPDKKQDRETGNQVPDTSFDAWIAHDLEALLQTPESQVEHDLPHTPEARSPKMAEEQNPLDRLLKNVLENIGGQGSPGQQAQQSQQDALAWLQALLPHDAPSADPSLSGISHTASTASQSERSMTISPEQLTLTAFSPDLDAEEPLQRTTSLPPRRASSARSSSSVSLWTMVDKSPALTPASISYDAPTLPRRGYSEKRREKRRTSEEALSSPATSSSSAKKRSKSSSTKTPLTEKLEHLHVQVDLDENPATALKRRQNTLAARRSRMRKAAEMDELRDQVAKLEAENRELRFRLGDPSPAEESVVEEEEEIKSEE